MFTTRCFLALLLCSLAGIPALGQTPLDTTRTLPDVTITATRSQTTTARAPVRVFVLEREAITATGSQTVAELLEARSPLFIKRYGDTGIATLAIRGTSAKQTVVLLDGYRIGEPQLGDVDVSLLPTILLESAEVVQGAASPLYGTDGYGGVVNLRTMTAGAAPRLRLHTAYGAWGERTGGLALSGARGRFTGLAAAEVAGSDGDFAYVNEALFPPREVRRTGADMLRRSFYSSLGYEGNVHNVRLAGWYNGSERGLPGVASTAPQGERLWDEHLRLWGGDEMRLSWGKVRFGGLVQQAALRYVNPSIDIDDTGRTLLSSAEAEVTVPTGSHWLLAGGLTGGYVRAKHPSLDAGSDASGGVFVHATGSFGRLLVYPALRADVFAPATGENRFVLSPRLGLNLRPFARVPLFLKASAGRAFRMPTFNERYWLPGGNTELKPEHGWTLDGGAHLQLAGGGYAEVSVFTGRMNDQILWLPTPAGHYGAFNLNAVRQSGFELGVHQARLGPAGTRLNGGLIYAYADARDRSDPEAASFDRQLRYVPREQLKGYAGIEAGPLHFDLNGRYAGRRYVTSDETQFLDPYIVLDAQARLKGRAAGFGVELAVALENMLDAEYAVVQGFPMPPRHAVLRLLIETGGR